MNVSTKKLELCLIKLKQQLKEGHINQEVYKQLVDRFTVYYKIGGGI